MKTVSKSLTGLGQFKISDLIVDGKNVFPSADATQNERQIKKSLDDFTTAVLKPEQKNQVLRNYGEAVKMSRKGIDKHLEDQAAARRLEAAQAAKAQAQAAKEEAQAAEAKSRAADAATAAKIADATKEGVPIAEAKKTVELTDGAKEMGLEVSYTDAYLIASLAMDNKEVIGGLLTNYHLQLFNKLPGEVDDSIKRLINPETELRPEEMMRLESLHAARLIADAKGTIDEVKIRTLAMQHLTEIERVKRVARGEETTNKPSRRN